MVKNYKPQGTFFFNTPDMEHMIKECKFGGHPRPIGPVFHALIHIKESQARLLKAYSMWSKHSPLCKFYFILVVHIMFQRNHTNRMHNWKGKRHFNSSRTIFHAQNKKLWCKIMINVLLCWLTIEKTTLLFFCSADFVSSRAAIIVHFQTENNQGLQKKIR